jgi:adenine/guanine phosphoribosyltransferase-like PRPP-binding protein
MHTHTHTHTHILIYRLEMHEDALRKGAKVLIIDDMIGTGATLLGACDLVSMYMHVHVCISMYECLFVLCDRHGSDTSGRMQPGEYVCMHICVFVYFV